MAIIYSLKLFFFFVLMAFLLLQASSHQHVDESGSSSSSQPYRTAYHFQPPKNWMNDPNGPMIYKGIYHLFYQYNPKGAIWDQKITWGHSTSTDLVNWIPHEPPIYPSQQSDINGAWSGSATILSDGTPAMLYTGIDQSGHQVQNLAMPKNPSDPYLTEWVKSTQNPLMAPTSENRIEVTSFRDPSTAWLGVDGRWRVIIGSKNNTEGLAIVYKSKDFVNWVQAEIPLHSAEETGIWECPDFYPVSIDSDIGLDMPNFGPDFYTESVDSDMSILGHGVKYVLKVSLFDTGHDCYTIGEYDHINDIYTPDKGMIDGDLGLRYDYGTFYASKSFFDTSKNRRISWAWIKESSSAEDDINKGWSGLQGVPRVIWLDKSRKQVIQWPIEEIEMLRVNPAVQLPIQVLEGGSLVNVSGITAAQADVEISFKVSNINKAEVLLDHDVNPQMLCSQKGASVKGSLGPFGLHVFASEGMEEYTSVFFRIFKVQSKYVVLMCSDQRRSSLNPTTSKTTYGAFLDIDPLKEELHLRCLIDRSIVESYGGKGKRCITARVYPTLAINEAAKLYAFNDGNESVTITGFSAWSMKKANIN